MANNSEFIKNILASRPELSITPIIQKTKTNGKRNLIYQNELAKRINLASTLNAIRILTVTITGEPVSAMDAINLTEEEVVKKAGLDYDKLQEVMIEHLMDKRN